MVRKVAFFDQVRRHIADCGMSQYRLGKECGIAASTLSRFMRGERTLSPDALERIAARLGLKVIRADRDKGGRSTSRKGWRP